jgi:hypothetical protein
MRIGPTVRRRRPIGAIGAIGGPNEKTITKRDGPISQTPQVSRKQKWRSPPLIHVQPAETPWSISDWKAFKDERAAIYEFDNGLSRFDADHRSWLDCVKKWLDRHQPTPNAVRIWTATDEEFRLCRIQDATEVLKRLGIQDNATIDGQARKPP